MENIKNSKSPVQGKTSNAKFPAQRKIAKTQSLQYRGNFVKTQSLQYMENVVKTQSLQYRKNVVKTQSLQYRALWAGAKKNVEKGVRYWRLRDVFRRWSHLWWMRGRVYQRPMDLGWSLQKVYMCIDGRWWERRMPVRHVHCTRILSKLYRGLWFWRIPTAAFRKMHSGWTRQQFKNKIIFEWVGEGTLV